LEINCIFILVFGSGFERDVVGMVDMGWLERFGFDLLGWR
jgi:hypothetical protein